MGEPNVKQAMLDAGLNAFGAQLLAESMLRCPDAKKITFDLPVRRGDCPGWIGVRFTLEPIPESENVIDGGAVEEERCPREKTQP